jgi:hypothetical protein
MRAISRYQLAPLLIMAAILGTGLSAHLSASAAPHSAVTVAGPYCPAGTNWDDILKACV